MNQEETKKAVRHRYAEIVKKSGPGCLPSASCCGNGRLVETISRDIGYRPEDLVAVPEGANLGLGCGNPVALASLKEGDTVLDLGAGAGFDCFLAARQVGPQGRVIGVDMTPEMIDKARENAIKGGYDNVEFRLGEIEDLPVADSTADIVISNCVINLSPEKEQVFQEINRVLKPGGRLMVSDIVLLKELPEKIRESIDAYVGCVAGAALKEDYLAAINDAGFKEAQIIDETIFPLKDFIGYAQALDTLESADALREMARELETTIASIKVSAVKRR